MPRTVPAGAALVLALLAPPGRAAGLPPDLAAVPADAAAFLTVDVPAVLASPLGSELRLTLDALSADEVTAFGKLAGFDPAAVRRVTLVVPDSRVVEDPFPRMGPTALSALVIVGCSKPVDRAALEKALYPAGRSKVYRGRPYRLADESWDGVLVLPGDYAFAVGSEDALLWLADRLAVPAAEGPLTPAKAAAPGHTVYAAVNPAAALPGWAKLPAPLQPLADARRVTLAVDLGRETARATLEFHYPTAAAAAEGRAALRGAFDLLSGLLKDHEIRLKEQALQPTAGGPDALPERGAMLVGVGLLRRVIRTVEGLDVRADGPTVRVAVDVPTPGGGAGFALVAVAGITTLGRQANATFEMVGERIGPPGAEADGLRKLAAALESYRADHGRYPPAAITAKDGTPLLSWRVALLPYLGEKELYGQFRLDEPWDGRHNKALIEKMPRHFAAVSRYQPLPGGRTVSLVVTGPGTQFDDLAWGGQPGGGAAPLVVEARSADGVYWTRPADPAATGDLSPLFGRYGRGTVRVIQTDGTVRTVSPGRDAKETAAALLRPAPAPR